MKYIRGAQGHCLKCGSVENLQAHHILPRGRYPELGLDLSNGAALCADCHKCFHSKFGKSSCNATDLCRFLGFGERETSAVVSFVGWRQKGGIQDLRKAIHTLELLIESEEAKS